jgi:hypothetical protein
MSAPAPKAKPQTAAAERMRRLRERRTMGLVSDRIEYEEGILDDLVLEGLLLDGDRESTTARAMAIAEALAQWRADRQAAREILFGVTRGSGDDAKRDPER